MNELKNRGATDVPPAAVDGPAGFPATAASPETGSRLRIVHTVRNSVRFVPYKDRKAVTAGLKKLHPSPSAESAREAPEEFAGAWDRKYTVIAKPRRNEIIPFFKSSPDIGKAVYTANAIDSVNYTIQKIIKHRRPFPNDEAAMKLMFMGLKHISGKRTMPIRDWGRPSINSQSFRGKTESPYALPL